MKYLIRDLQIDGRYYADREEFESEEDVVEVLLSYHSIDFSGVDDDDNELDIYEYLEYHNITTIKEQLDWVLEYGFWELEGIDDKKEE